MKSFKFFTALLILIVPLAVMAKAPSFSTTLINPVDISASALEYNKEKNTYAARGKVDLKEGTRLLKADYLTYDESTKEVVAEGNVVFSDDEDLVECQKLRLNLMTKRGHIENGKIYIKKGEFYISGQQIEKTGEQTYSIEKGELTTCGWDKPAWKFAAKNVELTVEGYAIARSANFYIRDNKAFYLPWGMFPVKTERQSGFLTPDFMSSSRDGIIIKIPYFWAISKDKDSTFYLDIIGNRGPRFGADFRYALSDEFKGMWYGSIINDTDYKDIRTQIRGVHEQKLKYDMTLKMNVNYVSDIYYLRDFAYLRDYTFSKDFSLAFPERGMSFIERSENLIKSSAFIEKPFPRSMLTSEVAFFRNLITPSNSRTVQYLPSTSFFTEYLPFSQKGLFFNVPAEFIHFYRQEGETFSRVRLEPTVSYPYSWNGINLLMSGGLLESLYMVHRSSSTGGDSGQQPIAKFSADANAQFMRTYHVQLLNLGELQSILKPRMRYTYISSASFRDLPRLDPLEPDPLAERVYPMNAITYSLLHYLNTTTAEGFREVSLFELAQTYGLTGRLNPSYAYDGFGERFSDISARLTFFLRDDLAFISQSSVNTYGDGFTGARNSLYYTAPKLYYVNLAHTYTRDLDNQLHFDSAVTLSNWDFRYYVQYSIKDSTLIDTLYEIKYHPKCWSLTMALIQTKRPNDTTIRLSLDLEGITGGKF